MKYNVLIQVFTNTFAFALQFPISEIERDQKKIERTMYT